MKTKKEILKWVRIISETQERVAIQQKDFLDAIEMYLKDICTLQKNTKQDTEKGGFVEKKPEKAKVHKSSEYIGLPSVYMWLKNQGYDVNYSEIKNACIDRKMKMLWKPASKMAKNQSSGNWYLLKTEAIELEKDIIQGQKL